MGKWDLHERTTKEHARQSRMNPNFDKCLSMLLEHEGGFVDGKKINDAGCLSNMGITKRTYDNFLGTDID